MQADTGPTQILDCESLASASAGLAALFGRTVSDLHQFLRDAPLSTDYEERWRELPPFDDFVFDRTVAQFGTPRMPSHVCWFHCTRVPPGTTFEEGILPLGARLPALHDMLVSIVDGEPAKAQVRQAIERGGGLSFHYGEKIAHALHWGPHAILVRDVAFHARALSQHDYLAMPEIIEDICSEVQAASGLDLLPQYELKLRPAIVKFRVPADDVVGGCIRAALCYVRSCLLVGKPEGSCVFCFDGENAAVASDAIVNVEFISSWQVLK